MAFAHWNDWFLNNGHYSFLIFLWQKQKEPQNCLNNLVTIRKSQKKVIFYQIYVLFQQIHQKRGETFMPLNLRALFLFHHLFIIFFIIFKLIVLLQNFAYKFKHKPQSFKRILKKDNNFLRWLIKLQHFLATFFLHPRKLCLIVYCYCCFFSHVFLNVLAKFPFQVNI